MWVLQKNQGQKNVAKSEFPWINQQKEEKWVSFNQRKGKKFQNSSKASMHWKLFRQPYF